MSVLSTNFSVQSLISKFQPAPIVTPAPQSKTTVIQNGKVSSLINKFKQDASQTALFVKVILRTAVM